MGEAAIIFGLSKIKQWTLQFLAHRECLDATIVSVGAAQQGYHKTIYLGERF